MVTSMAKYVDITGDIAADKAEEEASKRALHGVS